MRKFHDKSGAVLVATPTMREQLTQWRIRNVTPWSLGVDTEQFHPCRRAAIDDGVRKPPGETRRGYSDLPARSSCTWGGWPWRRTSRRSSPSTCRARRSWWATARPAPTWRPPTPERTSGGAESGDDLARHFADADVLVFPSRTDTFGLVILEAMASGTPVAGFDAPGPRDLIPGSGAGAVDDDLRAACLAALDCSREDTRRHAEHFSWRACAETFYAQLDVPPPPVRERIWRRGIQRLPNISLSMPTLSMPTLTVTSLSKPSLTLPELLPDHIPGTRTMRRAATRVRRMATDLTDRPIRTRRR